jgi:hypothetical protein
MIGNFETVSTKSSEATALQHDHVSDGVDRLVSRFVLLSGRPVSRFVLAR